MLSFCSIRMTRMIVDLNPAALRLTGLEKDAACSMRLEDLFSAHGAGGLDAMTHALDRTGFFHSREGYFLRRASKGDLPVNVSVSRIHTEPEPVGLVVARDISDRKQAEEALKQVETRYNSLVASTGVMVWEIGADGVLLSISPAFETITGWSSRDWIGRRFDELLHPDDRETAMRMHERAWQGETLPRYEAADSRQDRRLPGLRVPAGYQGSARAPPSASWRSSATSPSRSGPKRPSSRPTGCDGPRTKPNEPIGPRASSSRA